MNRSIIVFIIYLFSIKSLYSVVNSDLMTIFMIWALLPASSSASVVFFQLYQRAGNVKHLCDSVKSAFVVPLRSVHFGLPLPRSAPFSLLHVLISTAAEQNKTTSWPKEAPWQTGLMAFSGKHISSLRFYHRNMIYRSEEHTSELQSR